MPHPENLVGYSFIIKGKVGRGRTPSMSFWSKPHVSKISSSSRLGRGVFLPLHGQARFTNCCFLCVQRAYPRDHELTELPGQDMGLMPPLFYCLGVRLVLLLHGFVVRQACLVLWLSKPDFSNNH